jgi:hypothetical protein
VGVKNIYLFSLSLETRSLQRLTHNSSLWGKVLKSKYLQGRSIEYWYRHPNKSSNGSIVWKSLVVAFPLVGSWTAWKIGNGRKVKID